MIEYKTLFDSFNARNLTLKQVAQSYIEYNKYNELITNRSSLLMGPRGCGKTTLLKMLTIEALIEYNRINGSNLIYDIPFISIYIPTDIQWKTEVEYFQNEFKNNSEFVEIIPKALINTNIFLHTLKTFKALTDTLDRDEVDNKIIDFTKDLIKIWSLPNDTQNSFYRIEQEFYKRLDLINVLINKVRKHRIDPDKYDYPDFFYQEFLEPTRAACKAFEHYFKDSQSTIVRSKSQPIKWALCFDELELAPAWLQTTLFRYLRSKDQDFLFKLTSIPLLEFELDEHTPSAGSDYNPILLWLYTNKHEKDWEDFCNDLIHSKLKEKYNINVKPENLFGSSDLEKCLKLENPQYNNFIIDDLPEQKSILLDQFKELAQKDMSFTNYLNSKGIDLKVPKSINRLEDSEVHRKVKPIVYYRNYFIKSHESVESTRRRTRRIRSPFSYGWNNICKISDGNPRLIIGIVDSLMQLFNNSSLSSKSEISIKSQSEQLFAISKRYLNIWATHPNANTEISSSLITLKGFIQTIGFYFQSNILTDDFKTNPTGTFVVDSEINHKYISLILLGLYLGAFVLLDPVENISPEGVINKKFRLSFILYPYFLLPIRKEEKANNLSTILKKNARIIENQSKLEL